MPTVIEWSAAVDPSEMVRLTHEALAAGGAVVLPGDCGYLAVWKSGARIELPQAALLAWGPDELAARGWSIPSVARRLMTRAWPAPLAIEVPTDDGEFVRFRCPEHSLFDLVIPAVAGLGPILVADTGDATAESAIQRLGDAVALAVNAGERPVNRPTVVRATDSGYAIVEPGAFPVDEIERLSARIILFLCTGNTCRSPLAEALTKKVLADRLGCSPDELPGRGFWVLSAGVAAYGGAAAAEEAVAVAAEFGADLGRHASRPVNPQLLLAADDVITMTRSHLDALSARYPGLGPTARLLCGEDELDDPIGCGAEVYRACARTILQNLERFIPEWVRS